MKSTRILNIICKRVLRFRWLVLCGFGGGLFVTHAAVCAVSWHPLHALLAAVALLYLALEVRLPLPAARRRRNAMSKTLRALQEASG